MDTLSKYEIFFAPSWTSKNQLAPRSIVLVPSNDTWNNFGHRNRFYMWMPGEKSAIALALAFQNEKNENSLWKTDNVVNKRFEKAIEDILPVWEFPEFFSMQYEMNDYRNLILKFGVDEAGHILNSLNDLVYGKLSHSGEKWYKDAISSEAFNLSFMRNSQTIFAFYNASSLLSGVQFENLTATEQKLELNFSLSGFENGHAFNFSFGFDEIVPKQIAVVIGKNGVGKSRALAKIVDFALEGNVAGLKGENGRRPMLGKIVAISTPGETHGTFPAPPKDAKIRYERLLSERNQAQKKMGHSLPEVLIQLARVYDNQIGENSRWDLFEEIVSEFADVSSLVIGNALNPTEDYESVQSLVRGGEQKALEAMGRMDKDGMLLKKIPDKGIFPLSSGQVSFVRIAAQLCLTVENGTLILIDEPETHLHPNLITEFVGMLNRILELTGSIAIVATHSAYLVREVPRSQVHVIQESNGVVDVVSPRLKTFGADVGAISEFVFGDDIINRLVKDVGSRLKRSPDIRDTWKSRLSDELSPEAVMYLMEVIRKDDDELEGSN